MLALAGVSAAMLEADWPKVLKALALARHVHAWLQQQQGAGSDSITRGLRYYVRHGTAEQVGGVCWELPALLHCWELH
jgi:hypothetical protein